MLRFKQIMFCLAVGFAATGFAVAQSSNQVQLKIEAANRTLSVTAEEQVTSDPELAILHIGFETQPSDAKTAYAAGAKVSNEIVSAIKKAGIPEASIRSESQHLDSVGYKSHKFKLVQYWTVKVPPERVAEILDVAVSAGAMDSGEIDWTVNDVQALENQALDKASTRAKEKAAVIAKGMGVHLGTLLYVSNQVSEIAFENRNFAGLASLGLGVSSGASDSKATPLSIEPRKVSRTATVYAVFAIE